MPGTAVKEEEEEDEIPNEPVEVPPGVVLDKVEQLLSSGKVLLRYTATHGKGWGINGKVDNSWCSFKIEIDGTCQLVDDTVWVTETSSEWADSEVEWLEKLRTLALKVPTMQAKQPSALRPRECRKAVFQYHKAEYVKQRQAKAKAKAKSISTEEHDLSAENGKPPTKAQGPSIPKVKAALAKTPVPGSLSAAAKQTGSPAKPPFPKAPLSKLPAIGKVPPKAALQESTAHADRPAGHMPKSSTFPAFLAEVKARLTKNGEREKYRAFLAAVGQGTKNNQGITDALAGHDDFVEHYHSLQKPGAKSGKVPGDPATESEQPEPMADADTAVAEGPDEAATNIVALPRTLQSPVNVEGEVLSKLAKDGGDVAMKLVKLVLSKRLARAGLRFAMLKYARSQANEAGAFREMIILRGPPGLGKSTWAMEQLRLQVGLSQDEELVARLTHICSADDFFTEFKPDDAIEYSFDLEKLEMAYACNEARVRLAMEAGIHPLYVDNSHLQLWEMGVYARRAREAGYEVTIVAPQDIYLDWEGVDDLLSRCNGRPRLQTISRELLEETLKSFENLPEDEDPVEAVIKAERPSAASQVSVGTKRAAPPGMNVPAKAAKIAKTAPSQATPTAKLLAKSPAKTPPQQPKVTSMPDAAPKQSGAIASGRGSAESRAAASLLSSMRKKPS